MSKLLVSGIITTYKRPLEFVKRSVKSVLNQTYENIEVIVVDDSPEDFLERNNIKAAIEAMGENIIYIQHEKNLGACAARNTGLAAANGEVVGFLDDDDVWSPNKIELMLPKFNDKTAVVYCGSNAIFSETGNKFKLIKKFVNGNIFDELILENFVGSTSFPLIKASAIKEVGGFDILMQASQDHDVWLRLSKKYEFDFVKDPLVTYYIHQGEQIGKSTNKRVSGYKRIIEKNLEYLEKHSKAYNCRLLILAVEYGCNGQKKLAFETWKKAVSVCPLRIIKNAKALISIIKFSH